MILMKSADYMLITCLYLVNSSPHNQSITPVDINTSAGCVHLAIICFFFQLGCFLQVVYNANKLSELVNKKKKMRNWLDFYQLKYSRNQSKKPSLKVFVAITKPILIRNIK